MNPLWHLGFPALLDSSEQCWRSFLPASITNSSLEMMSFFITSLWKRLGPGPEDRCGVLHSGPGGSFTGLQLSIGGRQVAPPPMWGSALQHTKLMCNQWLIAQPASVQRPIKLYSSHPISDRLHFKNCLLEEGHTHTHTGETHFQTHEVNKGVHTRSNPCRTLTSQTLSRAHTL